MDFYVLGVKEDGGWGIPMKHARIIQERFRRGLPWWLCSPVFTLSRQEIARIATADLPRA